MIFFKSTFPPKNERRNSIFLLWDSFTFVFWKKLKTPKRHFEINWPLTVMKKICTNNLIKDTRWKIINLYQHLFLTLIILKGFSAVLKPHGAGPGINTDLVFIFLHCFTKCHSKNPTLFNQIWTNHCNFTIFTIQNLF